MKSMMYFPQSKHYDPKIPRLKSDANHQDETAIADALIIGQMEEADDKRISAGYSGSWSDGGCAQMLDALRLFAYGWNHEFPPEWRNTIKQQENEKDPEYEKFLELKKRFEG